MSDNLKSRGQKAFFWDFFGKMARHGTTFIVTIILARLLEPSDFGLIAMIMVIVMIAMVFTDVGLGGALIQRRRILPVHYSSVFYFNISVGAVLTIITFFSAPWISAFYDNEQLVLITQVMSLMFVINAFSSMQINKLRKELKYDTLAKADVSSAVLSGVSGIAMAFLDAGVWSLVAQVLLKGVFYNIFIWSASKWMPSLLFSFKALRQLWGFGFRMFISGLLEMIFINLDTIIIGKLFTPAILGFFDQAKRLNAMIIQYSAGSLMTVMFPVLSKVQNDLPRFQNIAIKTMGIISFVVFLILGVMYLISEELIVLLFTQKWLPSVEYFKIFLLSGFAYPISALLVNILSSRGNSRAYLRLEIYKKILQSINLYVGFLWGINGYLYGLIVVAVFGVSLNILFAAREIKLPFLAFVKPIMTQMIISVIGVCLIIFLTKEIVTYAIALLLLKSILFTIFYFSVNIFMHTSSYEYFREQTVQVLKRRKRGEQV